jgi:hypothetical protein
MSEDKNEGDTNGRSNEEISVNERNNLPVIIS